jgi:hypothetical protein
MYSGCSRKILNITYSECVSVALFIQHVLYWGLWPVWLYQTFTVHLNKDTIVR